MAEKLSFKTISTIQNYSSWLKLIHPKDIELFENYLKENVTKDNPYISLEWRQLGRDKKWHWFGVRGKVTQFDSNDAPIHSFGICIEISKYKENITNSTQAQLLISELNHINNSQKNNGSLESICTEVLKSFNKLTKSSNSVLLFSTFENLTANLKNKLSTFSFNDKDTDSFEWSTEKNEFIKNFPVTRNKLIQNNNETSLLGVHLNLPFNHHAMLIIERKEAFNEEVIDFLNPLINALTDILSVNKFEEKRKELESTIDFFIKQVPAPVAMFDCKMHHKFVSEEWRRTNNLGEPHEFINKSYYEIYPEEPTIWKENYQKVLAGETIIWKPTKNTDKLGETYWTEGVIAPWYTLDGSLGGMIMYYNDVTKRIEQEHTLINTLKNLNQTNELLKKSNEYLESFGYVCSHDLKEPLRNVANYIQLLFNKYKNDFDETSVTYMHYVLKGITRMKTLIDDILLYSKVIKQTDRKKEFLNLNNVIKDVKRDFSYQLIEMGGQIKIYNLPTIKAESVQINQLFMNLISNAIKFKSEKPLIIEIFGIEDDSFWEIHVSDNGIGIDESYHKSIFQAFKRLNSRHTYEGSGLGLSICQKIVEAHEGTIMVQSNPTGGCDFVIRIPKIFCNSQIMPS